MNRTTSTQISTIRQSQQKLSEDSDRPTYYFLGWKIFANDLQAITCQIYTSANRNYFKLFREDGVTGVRSLTAWDRMPGNLH
jgi:hypothetical protein